MPVVVGEDNQTTALSLSTQQRAGWGGRGGGGGGSV